MIINTTTLIHGEIQHSYIQEEAFVRSAKKLSSYMKSMGDINYWGL